MGSACLLALEQRAVLCSVLGASCCTGNNPTTVGTVAQRSCHCALWLCHQHWMPQQVSRLWFSSLAPSWVHIPQTQEKPYFFCSQAAEELHSGLSGSCTAPSLKNQEVWKQKSAPERNQDDDQHLSCSNTLFVWSDFKESQSSPLPSHNHTPLISVHIHRNTVYRKAISVRFLLKI